jgi:hypothetical protein
MMKCRIVLLWRIVHQTLPLRLYQQRLILLLAVCTLLILLRHIAGLTKTGTQTIGTSVAIKMVFCSHVAAIDHGQNERNAYTSETTEAHTLEDISKKKARVRRQHTPRLQHE